MATQQTASAEFSRIVLVDGLTTKGRVFTASADARERAALARRFGLLDLARLDVAGEVTSVRGGTVVQLAAHLSAEATQACVVTLAPVLQRIEADFVRLYAEEAQTKPEPGSEVYFDETDDDIDPLCEGRLDVGEASAEQLALELDPYPRSADAELNGAALDNDRPFREEPQANAFAALERLTSARRARKKRK